MPRQNVEFEFPDPDKDEATQEVEVDVVEEDAPLEVAGAVGREDLKSAKDKNIIQAGEVEIEVEDDTPEADRGRKVSPPPKEVTNEELENYSDKVKNRIKHFSKGYHDERRAKEEAQREREALETYTKNLLAENEKLKGSVDQSHNTLIESAKKQVNGEMALAQRQYKEAYESGEPDAILEAQTMLNTAQIRMERVNGLKPKQIQPLQPEPTPVQTQVEAPQPQVQRDEKAEAWRDNNPWFGSDDEMTAFALGLHNKLTKEGIDPKTDTYYEKINTRMQQVFPDQFDDGIEDEPEAPKQKSSNVVAPATRSTAPKKIRLTQSQIAIAKKLGVPLETYAKQAAELMRKQQ
jgi:hypothetical protein